MVFELQLFGFFSPSLTVEWVKAAGVRFCKRYRNFFRPRRKCFLALQSSAFLVSRRTTVGYGHVTYTCWLHIKNLAVSHRWFKSGHFGVHGFESAIVHNRSACSPAAVVDARLSLRTRASASLLAVFRSDAQSSPSWQRLLSAPDRLGCTSSIV